MKERSDEILTETLADLYLSQGMKTRARRLYEKLLEKNPDDESVRKKLELMQTTRNEDEKESLRKMRHDLDRDHAEKGDLREKEIPTLGTEEPPSFEKLDDMYRKMNKEKTAKKITMLKEFLDKVKGSLSSRDSKMV